ncbi:hypothetical protein F4561_002600 [Lipingzhangella halophila]|uniref:Uncharacterized protein n=1 Tax=Lipingzhangella halophila TaxID=1783352 RepID=A0A7W7RGY2_9ACTN|nr:hypothetical protein [Lipingzhangella halophila]MBB4931780.1 hypothetical protein [Lipingzhangella halophila]
MREYEFEQWVSAFLEGVDIPAIRANPLEHMPLWVRRIRIIPSNVPHTLRDPYCSYT